MKNFAILSLLIFTLFAFTEIFSQSIPQTINYQGILKDAAGVVVQNGNYNLTFKLYDAESGGTVLWNETKTINVVGGIINTQLGSVTPIPSTAFAVMTWLGITIESGSELTPRISLSSVPYSFMSMNVPNGSITATKIADAQVVKSLNGLKDNVNLVAGTNVTITPSGNNLTINAAGGGGGGTIGGSGTTNYFPLFTGATTLGNSVLYQTGGNIGIGTTTPGAKFELSGNDALINGLTVGRGTGNISNNSAFGYRTLYSNTTGSGNTAIGYRTLYFNTSGINNTAIGSSALYFNSTGSGNTAIGNSSLYENTTGGQNTAFGSWALTYNTTGNYNTATGNTSLFYNTTGNYNTANGYQALFNNTIGYDNTAIGVNALLENTEGFRNTAIGLNALRNNTIGNYNTANGYRSLYYNTEGDSNTAIGSHALYNNTTGYNNTAIGVNALFFNITGFRNTAIGLTALYSNTTGNYNTANGYNALYSNTTGYQNTANGAGALYFNTSGDVNTANGMEALYSNTEGDYNTANGYQALYSNTTGFRNTANGNYALYSNTTGNSNTANGYYALYSNTTGYSNIVNGNYALYHNTTQYSNTAVGDNAGGFETFSQSTFLGKNAYPNADAYSNVMGLGYSARPTATNQIRIGNSSVTSIGGYAGWTNLSDGRYKTSIQENVKGLDFVMKLRPVTYRLDVNRLAADLKEDQKRDENGNIITSADQNDINSRNEKSQIVYTGFIAQEVEKAANEVGFNFSGIDTPKNENDFYGLRYAEFVVPLVKAVQEQQKIIEDLTKRIEELERR